MEVVKLFVIFLALCTCQNAEGDDINIQNYAFAQFLESTMSQYPTWLSNHGLDPSPPVPGPVKLIIRNNVVDMDFEISNFYVSGISRGLQTFNANANLNTSLFSFLAIPGSESPNYIQLVGRYIANGSVLSRYPLEGTGQWRVVMNELLQTVRVEGFKITEDGYVDIMNAAGKTLTTRITPIVAVDFEGLLESLGGLGRVVEDGFGKVLEEFLKDDKTYPFPAMDHLLRYLDEVFLSTPLADIIGETTTPLAI